MTNRVVVFSDVHFDVHHKGAWASFKSWLRDHGCHTLVANGDIVDLAGISRHDPMEDEHIGGKPAVQIDLAVQELNDVRQYAEDMVMVPGNHEDRWFRAVYGRNARALEGVRGTSLKEVFYAHGLGEDIQWIRENATRPGFEVGRGTAKTIVAHGHRMATGWGIRHVAAANAARFPDRNTVVGHHHRAQMVCATSLGATRFHLANPHLSGDHEYVGANPNWQRGFTVLHFSDSWQRVTPQLVVMDKAGRFIYGDKEYGQ